MWVMKCDRVLLNLNLSLLYRTDGHSSTASRLLNAGRGSVIRRITWVHRTLTSCVTRCTCSTLNCDVMRSASLTRWTWVTPCSTVRLVAMTAQSTRRCTSVLRSPLSIQQTSVHTHAVCCFLRLTSSSSSVYCSTGGLHAILLPSSTCLTVQMRSDVARGLPALTYDASWDSRKSGEFYRWM